MEGETKTALDRFFQAGKTYFEFRKTWKYEDGDRAYARLERLGESFKHSSEALMRALLQEEQQKRKRQP